nr:immunoglobulin light chain junction region [Macaca mulatta]MOY08105.1 immunoglobulin light chain junction region [Macaca mulatta]MOY08845.1 immunoglobulin light chain junction region [Macaca mulatta]
DYYCQVWDNGSGHHVLF